MSINITQEHHREDVDAAYELFAKGLLAALSETPNRGYTPQEIALMLRQRAGIPEEFKAILDLVALFVRDVAEATKAARGSYEELLNRLVEQGNLRVRLQDGVTYYYVPGDIDSSDLLN